MPVLNTTDHKTIPNRHLARGLSPLIACLKQKGIEHAPLLEEAGISLDTLSRPNSFISVTQELAFTQLVIEEVQKLELGLTIGSTYHLSAYGDLGMAIQSSENLLTAISVLFENILITWTFMHWVVSEEDGKTSFGLSPLIDLGVCQQYMIDRGLIASYRIIEEALGHKLPLLEVHLEQSCPEYAPKYQDMFGCEIIFGSDSNCFKFPSEYLYTPFLQADRASFDVYRAKCQELCSRMQGEMLIKDVVQQHIMAMQDHTPSLVNIADMLNTTPRTLQRKLAKEGTSFVQILQEARLRFANKYLSNPDYSIDLIALKLRYNDASAFCHAYKKWTGQSPGSFRDSALQVVD